MDVTVRHGDITKQEVDAIVHPTDTEMGVSGGVGVALFEEGDRKAIDNAIEQAPVGLGGVIVTEAPGMAANHILHTAVKPHHGKRRPTEESIRRSVHSVLETADEQGWRSLVLPPVGCGVGGFDLEDGIAIILDVIHGFEPATLADVVLIEKDKEKYETITTVMDQRA